VIIFACVNKKDRKKMSNKSKEKMVKYQVLLTRKQMAYLLRRREVTGNGVSTILRTLVAELMNRQPGDIEKIKELKERLED